MSEPESMRELIEQLLAPDNSNDPAILQDLAANSNKSGDLETIPPKSPSPANLQIPPGTPSLEERLDRANQSARCEHVKTNGTRCGSPALRTEPYCYFHRIWRSQPERKPFQPDPNGIVWNLPILEDSDGIQMALQLVLDSVLSNHMDLKRASIILYGLQTAAANVRRTNLQPYAPKVSTELK